MGVLDKFDWCFRLLLACSCLLLSSLASPDAMLLTRFSISKNQLEQLGHEAAAVHQLVHRPTAVRGSPAIDPLAR
jgi:hypothetical protein